MKRLIGLLWIIWVAGGTAYGADFRPEGYRLQPGDVLQVVVWKETDLQSEVLIRPEGASPSRWPATCRRRD